MRFAGRFAAGGGDDQRHAGRFLEQALLLPQAVVLAQVVAVVAVEDDDRLVRQLQPVEGVEQLADLRVHERDRGVIGLAGLARAVARPCRGGAKCERGRWDVVQVARPSARPAAASPADTSRNTSSARRRACAGGRSRRRGRTACPCSASSSLIVISAPIAVGLLAVLAVGGEPAQRAAEAAPGVSVKILGSSSLSRPRGLNFAIHDGGSSRPSVPICAGTP